MKVIKVTATLKDGTEVPESLNELSIAFEELLQQHGMEPDSETRDGVTYVPILVTVEERQPRA